MFKGKLNSETLIACMESIVVVTDEAILNIAQGGCEVISVDPANVAIVVFKLHRDAFGNFEFGAVTDEPMKIGTRFGKLLCTIKPWGDGDVEFIVGQSVSGKAGDLLMASGIFNYSTGLHDPTTFSKEPRLPILDFKIQTEIDVNTFMLAVKALSQLNDYLSLGIDGKEIYMLTEGDEDDRLRATIGELENWHSSLSTRYSLSYLSSFCIGMKYADAGKANLYFGADYPLQISFRIANGKGTVSYLLAPRIER